jgi:hypothetical protein
MNLIPYLSDNPIVGESTHKLHASTVQCHFPGVSSVMTADFETEFQTHEVSNTEQKFYPL